LENRDLRKKEKREKKLPEKTEIPPLIKIIFVRAYVKKNFNNKIGGAAPRKYYIYRSAFYTEKYHQINL
jgi:hypothetical protein